MGMCKSRKLNHVKKNIENHFKIMENHKENISYATREEGNIYVEERVCIKEKIVH